MEGDNQRETQRASSLSPLHRDHDDQQLSTDEPAGLAGADHMPQHAAFLPSIEHLDERAMSQHGQHQQHPPPQHPLPPAYPTNGAPMPQQQPPPYPPPQYQYQNGAMPPGAMPPNGHPMRFPIPPQPALGAQQMTGGRHKKEIKRRTKTGCLTCRKRRIKVSR